MLLRTQHLHAVTQLIKCILMAAFTYQETFILIKATGGVKYIDQAIN